MFSYQDFLPKYRCSTWNMARLLLFSLILTTLAACSRPDPNPELKDAIYLDIQAQSAEATKAKDDALKTLAEHEANLKKVVPQTGQIRYAEKRVWEAKKVIEQFEQQEKYWAIRLDQRKMYVRRHSAESFHKGEVWKDEKEFAEYQAEKRLRMARNSWDARRRREEFLKEEGLDPSGAGKAPAGGGGHEEAAESGGH